MKKQNCSWYLLVRGYNLLVYLRKHLKDPKLHYHCKYSSQFQLPKHNHHQCQVGHFQVNIIIIIILFHCLLFTCIPFILTGPHEQQICNFPGCNHPKLVERGGKMHDYCGIAHAQLYEQQYGMHM